jgi:tetrahydromethanopterin S-methyltransferase subunit G
MTVDEVRTRIRHWLEEVIGMEGAEYLLDRPPGGWSDLATKDDFDRRFGEVDRRFGEVDRRFDEIDRRFDEIDRRFDALEVGIDLRITSAVNRAIASQTRWVFGAIVAVIPILAVIDRL